MPIELTQPVIKELELAHCSECGKPFVPTPLWIYQVIKDGHTEKQCSWSCFQKARARIKPLKKAKGIKYKGR